MVSSVLQPKDPDVAHLAPHDRPLCAASLALMKAAIREALRHRLHVTLQTRHPRPGAGVIRQALDQLFGTQRTAMERRLFFLFAAPLVRDLLLQEVRGRGGGVDVMALDVSLRRLETFAPRQARMVDLHYFAGLTLRETADLLGTTERVLSRELRFVKAWLANSGHALGQLEHR